MVRTVHTAAPPTDPSAWRGDMRSPSRSAASADDEHRLDSRIRKRPTYADSMGDPKKAPRRAGLGSVIIYSSEGRQVPPDGATADDLA
jgi:hypothetical protein